MTGSYERTIGTEGFELPAGREMLAPEHERTAYRGQLGPANRLIVRSCRESTFVYTQEIEWFEACANYVKLHVGTKSYCMRITMKRLEASLNPAEFLRVSRSAMVKVQQIRTLRWDARGRREVVLRDGTSLKVGREYQTVVKRVLEG